MSRSDTVFRCAVLSVLKHAYVPNGVAAHPRFEIVVVADDEGIPDWAHERNQKYADEHGVPYIRDVEKALKEHDVQVAIVSSEAERHCELAVRAANAGLHIVQDKPMSTKLSECDRLVEAVERNRVKHLMWNRNFLPSILHAHEVIQSGEIGELRAVHGDFYFAKSSGPPLGSRGPNDPPIDWLQRQIESHVDGSDGGLGREAMGELQNEGIYPLAQLRMLTGVEVKRVYARATAHVNQVHADNGVDDLATVSLEMENGLIGSLCMGRIGASSHPNIGELKLHILGSKGAFIVNEPRPEVAVYYRDQPSTEYPHRRVGGELDFLLMENFSKAIDEDGDTILDAKSGRQIVALIDAALESVRTGKPITL